MTRVALYARYSSDNQRDASIEDQLRICREQAKREKWRIVATYKDAAISGASMILRPGIQTLLRDAQARQFDVVLAEALDRISRDQADIATLFKHLKFAGVPIVTLLGQRVPGRTSASFLTVLGLQQLVATTIDEYVAIAARVAASPEWLACQRTTVRERLLASPIGDAPPVLLALDASLVLASVTGEREVPLADYFTGYRQSVRRPDELIKTVRIPLPLAPERGLAQGRASASPSSLPSSSSGRPSSQLSFSSSPRRPSCPSSPSWSSTLPS